MRTAAWVAVVVVAACCVLFAMWMMARWQRCRRALDEWAGRWNIAIELCAAPGCLQPREAPCHITEVYRNTGREGQWNWHRFVPARLVAEPRLLPREGPGRDT